MFAKLAVTVVAAVSVIAHVPVPLHPPPLQPVKVEPAAALAVRVTGVPLAKLAEQVAPQSIPAGLLVAVPEPVPAGTIVSTTGTGAKVAVTVVAVVSVTVHDPVPLHPPPLQPVNLEFAPGAAVSTTGVPPIKLAEQVAPQVIPGGTLDTVPEPLPARTMVSGTATAIVNGKAVEVPPSGAGLNTVTCAVPGVRMSVARIVAWSSVVRRTVEIGRAHV